MHATMWLNSMVLMEMKLLSILFKERLFESICSVFISMGLLAANFGLFYTPCVGSDTGSVPSSCVGYV